MSESQTPPVLANLSALEQKVVDAARNGVWAEPANMVEMADLEVTEDSRLRVRAEVIRELLMGRRGELDPHGVRVEGVRVVGRLDLDHVTAVAGLALVNCALPDGVTCRYARLREMNLRGSRVSVLHADGLRTEGHLFLQNATMHGTGEKETVRLLGAHIGGQAQLEGTQLTNDSGLLLVLAEARVEGALFLPAAVVCPAGSTQTTRRGCPDRTRQMMVRGLVFPALRKMSWRQWLHLLIHHTSEYWPQPYQQLAAVERTAGHDNNARQVLIAQQEDLRRRAPTALGGRLGRARHWLWGWLGHYGYRAHRLVTALTLTLALAAGLGYAAGQIATRPGHHAAERTATSGNPGTPCSTAELIGLGIDRGLPLGTTGLRARCDLDTGTRWGQAFTYAIWALQALVWALATLAIAAYTGLVRKPS